MCATAATGLEQLLYFLHQGWAGLTSPPFWPCCLRHAASSKAHSMPPAPSGFSGQHAPSRSSDDSTPCALPRCSPDFRRGAVGEEPGRFNEAAAISTSSEFSMRTDHYDGPRVSDARARASGRAPARQAAGFGPRGERDDVLAPVTRHFEDTFAVIPSTPCRASSTPRAGDGNEPDLISEGGSFGDS
jgi:hypothetical protein